MAMQYPFDLKSVLLHASFVVHDLAYFEYDQYLIRRVLAKQPVLNYLKELVLQMRLRLWRPFVEKVANLNPTVVLVE